MQADKQNLETSMKDESWSSQKAADEWYSKLEADYSKERESHRSTEQKTFKKISDLEKINALHDQRLELTESELKESQEKNE